MTETQYMRLFEKPPDPKVAFMTSVPPKKTQGSESIKKRRTCNLGPGSHQVEEKTNMLYNITSRPVSLKGYSLGSRTTPQLLPIVKFQTPAPAQYQKDLNDPQTAKSTKKCFGSDIERFHVEERRGMKNAIPGPGTYNHEVVRNRRVLWPQSFGGKPIDMPKPSLYSSILRNTDKLSTTKQEQKFNRKLAYLRLYYN